MSYFCRECGKECLWLKHKDTGKPAPIEFEPSENGNVFIKDGLYRVATAEEIEKAKRIGKPLYLNHFAACEFAKKFRKPKDKNGEKECVNCGLKLKYYDAQSVWYCQMGCKQSEKSL